MGLSRRRRADKSASSRAVYTPVQTQTYMREDSKSRGGGSSSGSTMRSIDRLLMKVIKCGLVSFEVLPFEFKRYKRQPASKLISKPNANHCQANRVSIADNEYDVRVTYSLNKHSRWSIEEQIIEQCRIGDLQNHNLLVLDTEWRPQGRGKLVTRHLATNFDHMRLAANELRTQLSGKSRRPEKISFSDQVAQTQQDRPLVSFGGSRGRVNRNSLIKAFEIPASEFEDAEAMRLDSFKRNEFHIEIKRPAVGIADKVPHSRLVDDSRHNRRRQRKRLDCRSEVLLDDDYCDFQSADYDTGETSDADESFDEWTAPERSAAPTVFDAMRFKKQSNSKSGNDLVLFSTLHDEDAEPEEWILVADDDETAEESTVPDALSKDVNSVLLQKRPVLNVRSHLALPERLERLFAGTDALCASDSQPRTFSLLLQRNLAESVSFEVISEENNVTKLAMRHNLASTGSDSAASRRISVAKTASMSDPFAFIRGLLTPRLANSRGLVVYQPQHGQVPVGWCRTEVWNETDARLAALRALPMFSASARSSSMKDSTVQAGSVQIECGICNSLMRTSAAAKFSKRSTALGGCGHRFCNACWVRHVTSSLSTGATTVECPSSGCSTAIDAAVLLRFCPDRLLPALAGAAFRAWQRRLPVSRFCPLPRCGRLLVAADDRGKNALCCCWTSFCLVCGHEPHWPVDCATAERYLSEMAVKGCGNMRTRELFATTSAKGKRCPGCQMLVEKGEGCSHMLCACGQHFCWDCGAERLTDHVCGQQRAAFIIKKFFAEDDLLAPNSERSLIYGTAIRARRARHEGQRLLDNQARLTARLLSAVGRSATNAEQLVADVVVASYLLEYTCVLLDANEAADGLQSEVQSAGQRMLQLLRSIQDEIQHEGRGFGDLNDAKMAERICDRLAEWQQQLESECQQLREIVNTFGGQFRAH